MSTEPQRWIATRAGDLGSLTVVAAEVPEPEPGEVTIDVVAVGVNPADYKRILSGDFTDPAPVGFEVSGVLSALGRDTELASGGGAVGDSVLAFRVVGGYATRLTVPARDVFAKPEALEHPAAANLLLAATTAAEMLHVTKASGGETIVLHGASGAVGVSVLQQAAALGIRVIGTAGPGSAATVERFGGVPVAYGPGLEERLGQLSPDGYAAALDAVGTDEAIDVSLAVVADRDRIVTIAAMDRGHAENITVIGGAMPDSAAYRDAARGRLIAMAAEGELVVPVARTYPFSDAPDALAFLKEGHPGGKLALVV